jgi:hypothetical protein
LLEYMENRADADIEGPNEAMRFQIRIEEVLAKMEKQVSTLAFGDYVTIEQKRYGAGGNEFYQHKVIGTLESNSWVDVPVQTPATATNHPTMEPIALVICCGVVEDTVYRVRVADCKKCVPSWNVVDSGGLKNVVHEQPDLPAENTVMWWLCRITDDEVRRKAVLARINHSFNVPKPEYHIDFEDALDNGINWSSTGEYSYWQNLHINNPELLPTPEWKEYLELRK